MKKSKKIIIIILVIVLAIFLVFKMISANLVKRANALTIEEIAPEELKDGNYSGHYELSPVKVALQVTIQDGEIKAIEITKHDNGLGKNAEKIVDKIVEKQSLTVDNVSGATVSSVAIKKAVENALEP